MIAVQGLLYLLKDFAAAASLVLILKNIFCESFRNSKLRTVLFLSAAVLYTAAGHIFLLPVTDRAYEAFDAVSNFWYIAAVFVFFRKPAVLRSLTVVFLYSFTVDMLWSFLMPVFGTKVIPEMIFYILINGAVSALILFFSNSRDVNVLAGAFSETPKWLIGVLLFFELTCYYKEFGVSSAWYDLFYAVSACMILICVLYLVFRVFRLVYTQNSILQRLNEQLTYSDQLRHSDEQLRSFRHDFKNHIIVLNSMFEQGNIQGAKDYFARLTDENSAVVNRFSTGNTVVDSLLNVKAPAAAEAGAEIDFSGMIPDHITDAGDMCVCVGNLIDNAVEACARLPREKPKTISVSGNAKNNVLVLSVENPTAEKNGRKKEPKTSKQDKHLHGIGLKNVRKIAEKHNGSLTLEVKDGVFSAVLLLETDRS